MFESASPPKMQPTFKVDLPISAEDAIAKLRATIERSELRDHVVAAGMCLDYHISRREQRFWSPHLSVQISSFESGCQMFGRFSPRPEIWTMFMAIYGVLLIVMFAATIFGSVQLLLSHSPWAFLLIPLGVLLIAGLHLASLVGQGLSADQMDLLRSRLDRTMELAFQDDRI
ncbi:MAG: hypothetical protein AB8B91_05430 [Rubripirellula sp.]